jgi:hypothetical protein
VVAARVSEVAAPSPALATTFQAPHRPSTARGIPATSTVSPTATNGSNRATPRKGTTTTMRDSRNRIGTRARRTTNASATAWIANAQTASRGVTATQATKVNAAATLTSGGRRWTGLCSWT